MDAHKIYRQIVILLALWAWLIELSLVQLLVLGVDISGTSALGGTAGAAVGATAGSALGGEFVLISLVPLVVQSLVVLPGQQSNLQQQNKQAWNMLSKLRMGI